MIWHYENEEKIICPFCDRDQEYVDDDIYNLDENKTYWRTCEHCREQFIWAKKARYSSGVIQMAKEMWMLAGGVALVCTLIWGMACLYVKVEDLSED